VPEVLGDAGTRRVAKCAEIRRGARRRCPESHPGAGGSGYKTGTIRPFAQQLRESRTYLQVAIDRLTVAVLKDGPAVVAVREALQAQHARIGELVELA